MGLFKKLFRRKKTNEAEEVAPSPTAVGSGNQNNNSSRSRSSLKNNEPVRIVVRPPNNQGQHAQTVRTASGSAGLSPNNRSNLSGRDSHSARERDMEPMGVVSPANAAQSQSEHSRVLSPRSQGSSGGPVNNNMNFNNKYQVNVGKHDNENVNKSNSSGGSSLSPRLSQQQLQQFDLQNNGLSPPNHPAGLGGGGPGLHPSMYTMSTDIPRGQMQAMDDMNRSDASSSSFNLSTDAEDSEYETLRRRGVIPRSNRSKPNQNGALGLHDDERLFPGLHDDLTLSTSQSGTEPLAALQRLGMGTVPLYQGLPGRYQQSALSKPKEEYKKSPPPKPQQNNQSSHMFTLNNETEDDLRAWNISPSTDSSNKDPVSAKSAGTQNHRMFSFDNSSSPPSHYKGGEDGLLSPRISTGPVDPPASNTSRSSEAAAAAAAAAASTARNFTSPKSRATSNSGSGFPPDPDFATFVDFNAFGNNAFAATSNATTSNKNKESPLAWRDEKKTPETFPPPPPPPPAVTRQHLPREISDFNQLGFSAFPDVSPRESSAPYSNNFSPTSQYAQSLPGGGGSDTNKSSLSELLAQAKNKQRRGGTSNVSRSNHRSSSRASSSSVNSAPAITAAFLRQHHNLGKYTSTAGSNAAGEGGANSSPYHGAGTDLSFSEGTSVSDIIQSLEATNQTRVKSGGSRVSYGHRSMGDTGAVSTARAVKERLREKRRKEREHGLLNNRSPEASSSDNSDNEASESWLFDEVTGALGPRGIAADLESLSGRSNRSKNSQGNKSHRSHRSKSRRSRPGSASRRHKSSGDSVDSPGSRTSRNSRYSHRSTKSYLSHMSEQSRSVANDLLRLEMQLAMVGADNENREDVAARLGVGGGLGTGTSVGGASSRLSRSGSGRKASTPHSRSPPSNVAPAVDAIASATRRTKIDVLAPPGKLGIILANKADSKGTVVSGVRTSSVLVDAISPGDRIIAIDGEDVSRMTVSEITTIMSRKADYERTLTVLTIPKQIDQLGGQHQEFSQHSQADVQSPSHVTSARSPAGGGSFVNDFSQYRR